MKDMIDIKPANASTADGAPPQRRRDPAATRGDILDSAMAVAAEAGALGFTLDAVAGRAGLSKGALLHHFASKGALLEALVTHMGDIFITEVEAEAARDPEPYGRNARAYLRVTINDTATPEDISIGRAMLAACAIEPAMASAWRKVTRRLTADDPTDPAGADDALMLRLIADGLWLSDLFGNYQVDADQRRALLGLLTPGHSVMGGDA